MFIITLSPNSKCAHFYKSRILNKYAQEILPGFFLGFWKSFCTFKSINKFKVKQNSSTELPGFSFNNIYHKHDPRIEQKVNNTLFPCFPGFSERNWFAILVLKSRSQVGKRQISAVQRIGMEGSLKNESSRSTRFG